MTAPSPYKPGYDGVYLLEGKYLATKSLAPGFRVHNEKLVDWEGVQYRFWDPYTSKLAGALKNGLKNWPFKEGKSVLYLGAASGVTPSFIADIVDRSGVVYCVEFAPRAMRDLITVCEKHGNMLPLLADARRPQEYERETDGPVDVIYQDVAQPNQAEIMISNATAFLEPGDIAMLAVKAASIDVTKRPAEIFEQVAAKLAPHFEILEKIPLEPYDKDHLFMVLRKR